MHEQKRTQVDREDLQQESAAEGEAAEHPALGAQRENGEQDQHQQQGLELPPNAGDEEEQRVEEDPTLGPVALPHGNIRIAARRRGDEPTGRPGEAQRAEDERKLEQNARQPRGGDGPKGDGGVRPRHQEKRQRRVGVPLRDQGKRRAREDVARGLHRDRVRRDAVDEELGDGLLEDEGIPGVRHHGGDGELDEEGGSVPSRAAQAARGAVLQGEGEAVVAEEVPSRGSRDTHEGAEQVVDAECVHREAEDGPLDRHAADGDGVVAPQGRPAPRAVLPGPGAVEGPVGEGRDLDGKQGGQQDRRMEALNEQQQQEGVDDDAGGADQGEAEEPGPEAGRCLGRRSPQGGDNERRGRRGRGGSAAQVHVPRWVAHTRARPIPYKGDLDAVSVSGAPIPSWKRPLRPPPFRVQQP